MPLKMCAIIRVVVVFPFEPVTATIGIRDGVPGGNSRSTTGLATYCGSPSVGCVCIRNPGAAFTSTIAPPVSRTGLRDVRREEVDARRRRARRRARPPRRSRRCPRGPPTSGRSRCRRSTCCRSRRASRTLGLGRDVVQAEPLLARRSSIAAVVDLDPRQHLLVADAAARVRVRDLDELGRPCACRRRRRGPGRARRPRPCARRPPARGSRCRSTKRLDDDQPAAGLGRARAGTPCGRRPRPEVEPDAAPVVAVERLGDDREADAPRPRRRPRPRSARSRRAAPGSPAEASSRCVSFLSPAMSTASAPTSSTSSWRGSAAGTCPGRAGPARLRSAGSRGCRGSPPRR